jgi:predicted MFS family arabinose efflux permease
VDRSQTATQPHASWIAIGSLAVGAFALVTSEFLPVGLLPEISRDLGATHGQTGLMVTMPGVLAAFAAPLSIHFARNVERRRVLLILLGLLVASNMIVAFAASFAQLMIGRALLGVCIGGFWTIAGALGPRLRPGAEGVRASAVILGGVSLGTVAGLPAGSLLGELFGWRYAFGASALFAAIALAALLALLPKIPAQPSAGLAEMLAILRGRRSRLLIFAASVMYAGTYAAYTYIAPFLSEKTAISGERLSAVLLASGVAGFFGNIAGGWLAGRDAGVSVLLTVALAIASILLLTVTGTHPVLAIPLVIAWGFSLGMQAISLLSWLQASEPRRRDALQALYVSLSQLAIGLGALTGGLIVDRVGTTGAMMEGALAAVVTLVIAIGVGGRQVAMEPAE